MKKMLRALQVVFVLSCIVACSPDRNSAESEISSGLIADKELGFAGNNADPGLYVLGISHLNIIVEDIEYATEFYGRTLGFVHATNVLGVM